MVELGDSLKQEGVVNPLPALMNSSKGKYTGQAAPKSCKVEIKENNTFFISFNQSINQFVFLFILIHSSMRKMSFKSFSR